MTNEQFEALRDWIDRRTYLVSVINERPRDSNFVEARLVELEAADACARNILVEGSE